MEKLQFLVSGEFWHRLFDSEFDRGYMTALLLVLVVIAVLLMFRFFIYLLFRTRSCKTIVIPDPQGEVTITKSAVESAVHNRLVQYPQLSVADLKLFRRGKSYMLRVHCSFDGSQGNGFFALVEEVRPALLDTLRDTFGINNLKKIRFVLEDYSSDEALPAAPEVPAEQNSNETDTGI